jgi:hypothetical protein
VWEVAGNSFSAIESFHDGGRGKVVVVGEEMFVICWRGFS